MVRTAFRQIDIRERQPRRLAEAQSGPVQQEKQRPECHRVQLDRAPAAGLNSCRIEEPSQFVARVDVGRRPERRSRFTAWQRRTARVAAADRMPPEAGKDVILVLAMPGQWALARQEGHDLRHGHRVAGGISIGMAKEAAQEVRRGRELRAMGLPPEQYSVRLRRAASCQTLQVEGRHFAKCREVDLGVDRDGGRIPVTEKVADHLHRHALVQKVLGGGMPQSMRPSPAGDDADACEAIVHDLAQRLSVERSDGRT